MDFLSEQISQWQPFLLSAASVVKIIIFFLTWAIVWFPIAIPIAMVSKWNPNKPLTIGQKLGMIVSLYLLAPPLVWISAKIEGVSFSDYGVVWQTSVWGSVAFGFAVAVAGLLIIFSLESLCGWIEWRTKNWRALGSVVLPILLLGLWIGAIEELVFRGFIFNELQSDYTNWLAAAISSLIFALGHLLWERKNTIPQLPGLFLLGMVLVLARFIDGGSLGLAWGLHAGWIWGLSCLDSAQLITYTGKSSPLLTGIKNQPLAGLAGILCLLGTGMTLWLFSY
jgi:hypothetical protein